MRLFIRSMVIVLMTIILLLVIATHFVSTDTIFNQVSEKLTEVTGRELAVKGEKNLRFFPSLSLELNNVHFANSEQGSRADTGQSH